MARQWCCSRLWRRCPPNLAKAHQNGRGVWLYKMRILRFLLLQQQRLFFADLRDLKPFSPLTSLHNGSRPRLDWSPRWLAAQRPAAVTVSRSPTAIRRMLERAVKEQKILALLQMPRRNCCLCWAPLHAADGHRECVSWLGAAHAESGLTETECPHCVDMSLASLRSRRAFFLESNSAPRALTLSSSQGPVRK